MLRFFRTRVYGKKLDQARGQKNGYRPFLEPLEDRTLLSTYLVTNLRDAGQGKGLSGDLRYCLTQANLHPGMDTIDLTHVHGTVLLDKPLPDISDSVVLVGPGAGSLDI